MLETLSSSTDKVCAHCGKALGSKPILGQFCCNGCATVYKTLHEMGLDRFYKLRESNHAAAVSAGQDADDAFLYLDHADLNITRDGETRAKVTLAVTGVHCTACVYVLERLHAQLAGVYSSRLDFGRSELSVEFDPKRLRLSALGKHLSKLGYPPTQASASTSTDANLSQSTEDKASSRSQLIRMGVAGFCAANSMMVAVSIWEGMSTGMAGHYLQFFDWVSVLLSIPTVTYAAWPFYKRAWQGLRARIVSMDLPISGAILLGFALSTANAIQGKAQIYFDSINTLVFLLLVGRYVQWKTLHKVRGTLERSASLLPSIVTRVVTGGGRETVPLSAIHQGDTIVVSAGERIPADGVVVSGESRVDRALLTGESKLFGVSEGMSVVAGSLNVSSRIVISVIATGSKTELGQIEERVRSANLAGTRFQSWVDQAGKWFAVGIAVLSIATLAIWVPASGWALALDHLLALWIVSCPCAVGLATPLALSLAVAAQAREGILVANVDVFEKLERAKSIVFDKTGTLTTGLLKVNEILWTPGVDRTTQERVLGLVRQAESDVRHPIATAVVEYVDGLGVPPMKEGAVTEVLLGQGVRAGELEIGSREWIERTSNKRLPGSPDAQGVGVLLRKEPIAWMSLSDGIRPEAAEVINALRERGLSLSIFSGDSQAVTTLVGAQLDIQDARGGLKVDDKAAALAPNSIMVGDGINDAPALASAAVGIGFSGGATAALKAAPVYLSKPDLRLVLSLLKASSKVRSIVSRNVFIAIGYNLAGSTLAVTGLMNPLAAALVMPINSLTVVTSTLLAFRKRRGV